MRDEISGYAKRLRIAIERREHRVGPTHKHGQQEHCDQGERNDTPRKALRLKRYWTGRDAGPRHRIVANERQGTGTVPRVAVARQRLNVATVETINAVKSLAGRRVEQSGHANFPNKVLVLIRTTPCFGRKAFIFDIPF
ncbi:MAG: hypothetical protein ABIW33_03270 [Sphingomicrobium sp.]